MGLSAGAVRIAAQRNETAINFLQKQLASAEENGDLGQERSVDKARLTDPSRGKAADIKAEPAAASRAKAADIKMKAAAKSPAKAKVTLRRPAEPAAASRAKAADIKMSAAAKPPAKAKVTLRRPAAGVVDGRSIKQKRPTVRQLTAGQRKQQVVRRHAAASA